MDSACPQLLGDETNRARAYREELAERIARAPRRILLGGNLDAASAGYRVGHDDVSPFSREYKRHFGQPPMRDVERLRQGGDTAAAARRARD